MCLTHPLYNQGKILTLHHLRWPWPLTRWPWFYVWHTTPSWWTFVTNYFVILQGMSKKQRQQTEFSIFIWPWPLVTLTYILRKTTQHGEYLCLVILKSIHVYRSYTRKRMFYFVIWPLTHKCDLDLYHRNLNLLGDTLTHYGEHLTRVILKSLHSCGSDTTDTGFALTPKCDLDLWMADLGFVCDTLPYHIEHLYQINFTPLRNEQDIDQTNPERYSDERTDAHTLNCTAKVATASGSTKISKFC
jgi:hypothetical protein